MGSLNQVTLVGNLGRDAELRYTPSGAAVASFSVATTETWRDKGGEKQERTEWHKVNLWGKAAESLSEYLVKGKQVAVVGSLQTRKWQDKDGKDRQTTEIKAFTVALLGGGNSQPRDGGSRPRRNERELGADNDERVAPAAEDERQLDDSDIPF